jgi:hypothetical protein
MLSMHRYSGRITQQISNINKIRYTNNAANESELVAVWVFHRHGDRTPGQCLVEDSYRDEESAFWRTKIPPIDRTHYDMLSEKFPAVIHPENNQGQFLDAVSGSEPYGFLTWNGMQQLYEKGRMIGQRYRPENNEAFTDYWNVQAYSTNYLRTVKSLQCFLDGICRVGHQHFEGYSENGSFYERVDPESYLKANHIPKVEIFVRHPKHETLNRFDTDPDLMKRLVRDAVQSPEFVDQDAKAAPLAARLSNYIPGLIRLRSPHGSPSTINWIHAADHFICRSSHDVPLSAFSYLACNQDAEQILQSMKHATVSHLATRFRYWYKSPPLLAEMMLPLLTDIYDKMMLYASMTYEDRGVRKPFNIYSCHDVTILGLLYSIEADFLASSDDLKSHGLSKLHQEHFERLHYWPEYACTLVIELSKVKAKGKEDEFLIQFLLNGQVVHTMSSLRKGQDTMTLSDFYDLITNMNARAV